MITKLLCTYTMRNLRDKGFFAIMALGGGDGMAGSVRVRGTSCITVSRIAARRRRGIRRPGKSNAKLATRYGALNVPGFTREHSAGFERSAAAKRVLRGAKNWCGPPETAACARYK
jgi:hypothetical protein